jgi:arylsulfatase A-like enzyme
MYARYKEKPWVLYDVRADPHQLANLAADASARPVLEEMERRLKEWMERTGDSWANTWPDPVEDAGRLYRHRAFYTIEEYRAWVKATGAEA